MTIMGKVQKGTFWAQAQAAVPSNTGKSQLTRMDGACPSRASVVPLGGWYSERRVPGKPEWYHVGLEVSVRHFRDGVRGSGQLIPPNRVEVRFDHNPAQLRTGAIQLDGRIRWNNDRTWTYGYARAQRWTTPWPDAPISVTEQQSEQQPDDVAEVHEQEVEEDDDEENGDEENDQYGNDKASTGGEGY